MIKSGRYLFFGVTLVSMSMLALETLLPRIFAVYVGPNFVYFSISVALVGLSSAGIIVSVWDHKFSERPQDKLVLLALLFSVSTFLAIVLISVVGNSLNNAIDAEYARILGDSSAWAPHVLSRSIVLPSMLFVAATGVLTAIPFLFAGLCIALVFRCCSNVIGKVYAYDLVGAGLGCVFTVASLTWLSAMNAFILVSLLGAAGGLLFSLPRLREERRLFYASCLTMALFAALFAWSVGVSQPFEFGIHKYAQLRSFYGGPTREFQHRWTPLGRISLLHRMWSPPLSETPRLRSKYFVAMDLGGHSVVETFSPENLAVIKNTSIFSDDVVESIVVPGMYRDLRDYIVLMAGNGQDMLRAYAWYGDKIHLQGVELNPVVYELGFAHPQANLRAFFDKPNVEMVIDEGRSFIERSEKRFDLLLLSYSGATFATGTGALASTPQFLFTKEAYVAYLRKLNPGGVLVVAGGTAAHHLPGSLRTFAAALKVFDPSADVKRHVLTYRRLGAEDSAQYIIHHRDPLTAGETARIQQILAAHNLELTYSAFTPSSYPEMERFFNTANPEVSDLSWGFRVLAEDRVHTDNQPFYYFSMIWGSVGGFLVLGYAAAFFSALIACILFLLVPLVLNRRRQSNQGSSWYFFLAIAMLGSGFMLIEVGSIQKFELFLGNPPLTLVAILSVLLVSTGVGSFYSNRLFDARVLSVRKASFLVVLYGLFVLFFLNHLIYRLMGLFFPAKLLVIAAVLFPMGFLLGNLFPQLLRQLRPEREQLIPTAWAINGVFSVASSNLGAILYLFWGATAVVSLGLCCYAILGLTASVISLQRTPSAR